MADYCVGCWNLGEEVDGSEVVVVHGAVVAAACAKHAINVDDVMRGLEKISRIIENVAQRGERTLPEQEVGEIASQLLSYAAGTEFPMDTPAVIDARHLERQRAFSERTFGPGRRTSGIVDHIRKELMEVQAEPDDLGEWVDVAILALDGAWRAGHEPQAIIDAIIAKQERNEARDWPDWREAPEGKAIEHFRTGLDYRDSQGHLVCGTCGDEVAYCGGRHG